MARGHAANDYGAPADRTSTMLRPLLMANHALHWVSTLIVLAISGYFIDKFSRNTHLVYWISIAAIDTILYIPALVLPAMKTYKGYLAPLAWIFSYLWLTAFIFAAQDYNFDNCIQNSPRFVPKCSLKKTLEAFAFLAFFTNLVGQILEGRLWDVNRVRGTRTVDADKHHATVPATTTTGGVTV
ncbi:hypothetical protein BDV95DRAFT_579487 [Massariosphaeria phaeospora]|uniref:MARVEL domain-containing protein n=1 Tax=Massariosphaeria phaeospora TaxID=100035 RepID=A0A7C8M8K8_9PLEO|nr:hypothetical protein BDV95DRAFT_579487 [Massariosphaeria phaeospora]